MTCRFVTPLPAVGLLTTSPPRARVSLPRLTEDGYETKATFDNLPIDELRDDYKFKKGHWRAIEVARGAETASSSSTASPHKKRREKRKRNEKRRRTCYSGSAMCDLFF